MMVIDLMFHAGWTCHTSFTKLNITMMFDRALRNNSIKDLSICPKWKNIIHLGVSGNKICHYKVTNATNLHAICCLHVLNSFAYLSSNCSMEWTVMSPYTNVCIYKELLVWPWPMGQGCRWCIWHVIFMCFIVMPKFKILQCLREFLMHMYAYAYTWNVYRTWLPFNSLYDFDIWGKNIGIAHDMLSSSDEQMCQVTLKSINAKVNYSLDINECI